MTAEPWFHEYGFVGDEDFESVVEYAESKGFAFVYGGATKDPAWIGYPAEYEALQALVVSERASAEQSRIDAEHQRERADRLHDDLRESEDFHAERHEQLRERADQAEKDRDEQWKRFSLHVETMIEPKLLARAQHAETALREIEALPCHPEGGRFAPAIAIARAALSGLAGVTVAPLNLKATSDPPAPGGPLSSRDIRACPAARPAGRGDSMNPVEVLREALQRAGATEGYTVPGITTPLGNFIANPDAPQVMFKEYYEAEALAALADVEALVKAANEAYEHALRIWPAPRMLGKHMQNLGAALRPFGDSDKETAA